MRMTIDEALTNLESLQKDYQAFYNAVWQDPEYYSINAESLKIAIDIMRKYQKIQKIVKHTQQLCSYGSAFIDIRKVIKDGNRG